MLKLEHVTKYYDDFRAVNDLSFEIHEGEIFGLLGVNGAGKTTTFRMIMGLLDITEGKITLNDKKIDYSVTDEIGFLTEERSLLPSKTVLEQAIYYGVLKGLTEKEVEKRLDKYLEEFNITEYKNKKIKELSKGNQQKIQFISAIMHNPELIVLDEPFSGLDPVNTELLKNIILELVDAGKYIVMSSHQMNSVEEFCQEVVILNKGKTVLKGNLNEIKDSYKVNKIEIDTKSDINQLIKNQGLEIKEHTERKYVISIKNEEQANELLKEIVNKKISIEKFELVKPTLHEIFIEKVGEQ